MKILVGLVGSTTWLLVVAAILGPKASLAEIAAVYVGGLWLLLAGWLAYQWLTEPRLFGTEREDWDDDIRDAPYLSNQQWLIGLMLLGLAIPFLMVYDAVMESWLVTRWKQLREERKRRDEPVHGQSAVERIKRLEW